MRLKHTRSKVFLSSVHRTEVASLIRRDVCPQPRRHIPQCRVVQRLRLLAISVSRTSVGAENKSMRDTGKCRRKAHARLMLASHCPRVDGAVSGSAPEIGGCVGPRHACATATNRYIPSGNQTRSYSHIVADRHPSALRTNTGIQLDNAASAYCPESMSAFSARRSAHVYAIADAAQGRR